VQARGVEVGCTGFPGAGRGWRAGVHFGCAVTQRSGAGVMAAKSSILIVEDSVSDAKLYREYLRADGHDVEHCADGESAKTALARRRPDVLLLDLHLPDMDGFAILDWLKEQDMHCEVIMTTVDAEVSTAVRAMQLGAGDYLTKPIARDRLLVTVHNALERGRLSRLVSEYERDLSVDRFHGLVGASAAMRAVYRTIDNAASSTATCLIQGESGTGKELCARALHDAGARAAGNFVPLNCAALPRDLLESELFGHMRGAFTGAEKDREGASLRAHGGTLFLDEICEMDRDLQGKLLRLLQTGEVQRLGSNRIETVDVRFVGATNRVPWDEVRAGRFREDLYYRLNVIPIRLPPLRERGEDVLLLADHFLRSFSERENKRFKSFSGDARRRLQAYAWPGNVRELENTIHSVVVLHDDEVVEEAMLPETLTVTAAAKAPVAEAGPGSLDGDKLGDAGGLSGNSDQKILPLHVIERYVIEQAIAECSGNIQQAARLLEVNPSTIYRKKQRWETGDSGA